MLAAGAGPGAGGNEPSSTSSSDTSAGGSEPSENGGNDLPPGAAGAGDGARGLGSWAEITGGSGLRSGRSISPNARLADRALAVGRPAEAGAGSPALGVGNSA